MTSIFHEIGVIYVPVGKWPSKGEIRSGDFIRVVEVIKSERRVEIHIEYIGEM